MKFEIGEEVLVTGSVYGIYPTKGHKARIVIFNNERKKYLLQFNDIVGGFYYEEGCTIGKGLYVEEKLISKITIDK